MTLDEFVTREASLPPYPGACCRMIDRWLVEAAGFSALRRFGRDFESDADVERWLGEPGGLAVAVNRVMRVAGFKKTKQPAAGDVGLVIHKERICMALNTGSVWLIRDDQGLAGLPRTTPCKAWRVA